MMDYRCKIYIIAGIEADMYPLKSEDREDIIHKSLNVCEWDGALRGIRNKDYYIIKADKGNNIVIMDKAIYAK